MTKILIAIGVVAAIAICCAIFKNNNKGDNSDYYNW